MTSGMKQNISLFTIVASALCFSLLLVYWTFVGNYKAAVDVSSHSLKPDGNAVETVGHRNVEFNVYRNRDLDGSSYSIHIPADWTVRPKGIMTGELIVSSSKVKGLVELTDMPDSSPLMDWILFSEEPKLKRVVPGFERENIRELEIDGRRAYQLTYTNGHNGRQYYADRTYIMGARSECIITLLCKRTDRDTLMPLFTTTVASFRWSKE
jgi:hypothetical protein